MKKIAIIGISGYSGLELLRLLHSHPDAEIVNVYGTSNIGAKLKNTAPNLFGAVTVFNKAIGCRNRQPYFLYFPVFLKCLRIRHYHMRL